MADEKKPKADKAAKDEKPAKAPKAEKPAAAAAGGAPAAKGERAPKGKGAAKGGDDKAPAKGKYQVIVVEGAVEEVPASWCAALVEGGRMAVISFHSLEDRIVKRFMREASMPPGIPARRAAAAVRRAAGQTAPAASP